MVGQIEINLEDEFDMMNEHGVDKGMEATGGSRSYQKATNIDEDTDFNPDGKGATEGKEKEFGGDISSICIAPFEDDQIKGG